MKTGWMHVKDENGQDIPFAPKTSAEAVEGMSQLIDAALLERDKRNNPVGKIIINVSGTNPATYLGFGTWAQWGQGRVPVGVNTSDSDFSTAGKTGGAKTHTLAATQLPAKIPHMYTYGESGNVGAVLGSVAYLQGTYNGTFYMDVVGGGQPHNNLQPYITCYMWRRTA